MSFAERLATQTDRQDQAILSRARNVVRVPSPSCPVNYGSAHGPNCTFRLDEVAQALKSLKCDKAAGINGIAPELLKVDSDLLKKRILDVFDSIFAEGSSPARVLNSNLIMFQARQFQGLLKPPPHITGSYALYINAVEQAHNVG